MHRLLFAIGLSAILWATSARTGPVPSDAITTMAGPEICAVDGDSHDPNDSDQQWRNAHHALAVVTQSAWKSAPVHAGLRVTRGARILELARFASSPDPPADSTPIHLRHAPLLI